MAALTDTAIAVGSSVATVGVAWLGYKGKLVEKLTGPAKESADAAAGSADKADQTAMAFVSVIVDLQRRVEHAITEVQEAKSAAQAAKAAEERCLAEQKRLEAIMEGIISERQRQR